MQRLFAPLLPPLLPPLLAVTLFGTLLASSALVTGCGSKSDGGTTTCDVPAILASKCAFSPCHDTATKAANFDMQALGLEDRLVGVAPPGGGTASLASMCTMTMTGQNLVYLDPGSSPATGLFLRKLGTSPCGAKMPLAPYPPLSAAQIACIQTWADGVVAAHSASDAGGGS